MNVTNTKRNRTILALYGKKSFGLIAKELGISRNTVAGIVFRHRHPYSHMVCSPNSKTVNKIGTGHHGGGKPAAKRLPMRNQWTGPAL